MKAAIIANFKLPPNLIEFSSHLFSETTTKLAAADTVVTMDSVQFPSRSPPPCFPITAQSPLTTLNQGLSLGTATLLVILHRYSMMAEQELKKATNNAEATIQDGKWKDLGWLTRLEELKDYKRFNGKCLVPRGYSNTICSCPIGSDVRECSTRLPRCLFQVRVADTNRLDYF